MLPLKGLEQFQAACLPALKQHVIIACQKASYFIIERLEREERHLADGIKYTLISKVYGAFHQCLILRGVPAGWINSAVVVTGKVFKGSVDIRFVFTGPRDSRFQIVWDDGFGNTAIER